MVNFENKNDYTIMSLQIHPKLASIFIFLKKKHELLHDSFKQKLVLIAFILSET